MLLEKQKVEAAGFKLIIVGPESLFTQHILALTRLPPTKHQAPIARAITYQSFTHSETAPRPRLSVSHRQARSSPPAPRHFSPRSTHHPLASPS